MGVQGYGNELRGLGINSVPVGSEEIIEMYPLDFEVFLWANGLEPEVIEVLRKFYNEEVPVPATFVLPVAFADTMTKLSAGIIFMTQTSTTFPS